MGKSAVKQSLTAPASEIAKLKNLGAVSARHLNSIGIYTRADLEKVGAVDAYRLLRLRGYNVSLVLVYAIQGALMDLHWNDLPPQLKQELRREAEE